MAISIEDHQLPYNTHNLYDVNFFDDKIRTLVTHTPSFVNTWIAETQQKLHQNNNPADHPLLVGLDIEWRPNRMRQTENPVATLQISTGKDCLIFQLLHCPTGIPQSLYDFLSNKNYTFVGVGIEGDVEKLVEDYDVSMGNAVDLRVLAAEKLGAEKWKNSGIKSLVKEILGKQIEKPKRVTMSRWDNEWLTGAQVQYACLDAFLCYKIGENLYAA
ncbi:PREDICTED: Werner Syndrome-like exonuclease [Populus euphratica]|uniref:Werner Syndrome-like exonuclease n=1 Tax=Populus euphratica TaxID=75702 RepID=A0AAJ6V402_POPEU|nr:PREDICTED: Werner Syndrome-like exonuclease [Populus euphratica]